ncbi:hypothetical protein K491DRAFT_348412 [Lophiostoma macrostomum CBS 122681]|uniref:Uncharacterized protein n=1 Tax=Lophiostoma macrostomum CBS 122681 TaxID=1314788 RepID=A0A6A6TAR0_9PLEO|nr:hypothetical protein K491DRAFT_348412 [Lophiostoma macrostomum CBS 122681]
MFSMFACCIIAHRLVIAAAFLQGTLTKIISTAPPLPRRLALASSTTPPSNLVYLTHVKDSYMTAVIGPLTDFSMRQANDKEVLDLEDLFNQYVETEFLQFNSDTTDPSSSDDLAHLFELPSNESVAIETPPMPNWADISDDAWRKALAALEQNPASPVVPDNSFSIYPESRGKASLSDPEVWKIDQLFELESSAPRRSFSNPSTPRLQIAKPAPAKAVSNPDRSLRNGIQKAAKKTTAFTKMMRPSHFCAGIQDLWSRKIEGPADTFNLHLPSNGLSHSPPSSTKFAREESSHDFFLKDQPYTIAMSPLPNEDVHHTSSSNYQLTPLSSPPIDTNSFQFSSDGFAGAYIPPDLASGNAALSALQTPPPSHRLPMTTWGPDSPTPANVEFAFSASPEFEGKAQGWWGHGVSGNEAAPDSQPEASSYTATSTSQGQSQNGIAGFSPGSLGVAGLGISCDTASFSEFTPGTELSTPNPNPSHNGNGNGYIHANTVTMNGFTTPSVSTFDTPYIPDTLYTSIPQSQGIHIGNPLSDPRSPTSRSPSPFPQPRFTRRRHSSQNHAQSHSSARAHRRKSSSNSSAQSNGYSHHRTSSSSASHARSSSGSMGGGFVNLTPADSGKLLTGVAPSGSSKTKARREKEAADRRRKLSQAAVKAVRDAGGDLRGLDEGLLALSS